MNKARIYLDEQRIRGVDPVSKWVWSVFIQNLCILSRGDERNCYTRGNVTSWLCFDYCTRGAAQWVFIQSLGLASAHVEEFAECCSEEGRGVLAYYWEVSRLRSKEVFSTDLIRWRGVNATRRRDCLVCALVYFIEIRSCYPRRDIIQISGDI